MADEELKGLITSFGQELMKLDRSYIDGRKESQFRLDPNKILATEGGSSPSVAQSAHQPEIQKPTDDNQLEMSFELDPQKIYDSIESIYREILRLKKDVSKIVNILEKHEKN